MPFSVPVNLNATNNFGVASFIVDASLGSGTHTSISNAISDILTLSLSNQTIFIRPGTYTENFTLPATINLAAFSCDAITPNVTILGKITCNDAGSRTISGIRLQTNSDFALVVSGTLATVVNLTNCYLNFSNNTGISFTSSSASALIQIYSTNGNLGTTGIKYFASTSSGSMYFFYCELTNSGASSTASTATAGFVYLLYCYFLAPITSSSTANLQVLWSNIFTQNTNATGLTVGGSGGNNFLYFSEVLSGTGSAISVGTGVILGAYSVQINSSNANVVTGLGTIQYSNLNFSAGSANINTTTQVVLQSNNTIRRTATSTTPYVVLSTDYYISVDASGGAKTIQLPNAPSTNQVFIVKDRLGNASLNNITVTTPGGVVNLDGATTYVIINNYAAVQFLWNGTTYEAF